MPTASMVKRSRTTPGMALSPNRKSLSHNQLAEHGAGGLVERGHQMRGRRAGGARPPDSLAVDGYHPAPAGHPGAGPDEGSRQLVQDVRVQTGHHLAERGGIRCVRPRQPQFGQLQPVSSPAHSPIAVNERAPATTAASATATIPGRACRTPRRARGSGTSFSSLTQAHRARQLSRRARHRRRWHRGCGFQRVTAGVRTTIKTAKATSVCTLRRVLSSELPVQSMIT